MVYKFLLPCIPEIVVISRNLANSSGNFLMIFLFQVSVYLISYVSTKSKQRIYRKEPNVCEKVLQLYARFCSFRYRSCFQDESRNEQYSISIRLTGKEMSINTI